MHCRSCELIIEDELKKVSGITSVSVNHQTGIATISCHGNVPDKDVKQAVENAGYTIGQDGNVYFFSRNHKDYIDVGVAFFIVTALFLVGKTLGIFNLGASISGNYSSLPIVFLVGLTAGVSTCMALVGGLILGASARFSAQNPHASRIEKFKPHIFFNLGRIASYVVFGGAIGLLGSMIQLSTSVLGLLTITVGVVMLLLGGQLIDIFPILKRFSITLPKRLSRMLGIQDQAQAQYSNTNAALMGAMTFFLPCGFTQAMQLYAMSTGSVVSGALTMGVFALGTAPGLLGVGGLSSVVKGNSAKLFFKTAGVVVILLALFNISNGLNLLGINAKVLGTFTDHASSTAIDDPNVKIVNGVQEVRMTQKSSGYSPNSFTIKKGIAVRWIITSEDAYSCASSIVSQQIGVRQSLKLGENIIEFTPTEEGTIHFSCSMGMYTGSFRVVGDTLSTPPPASSAQPANTGAVSCGGNSGGCGCGAKAKTNTVQTAGQTTTQGDVQLLQATYTSANDITPNQFSVKVNQNVRFEIAAKDDGQGCMGSITVPGLTNKVEGFEKNKTIVFEFTPTKTGTFPITCAMGVPRGQIQVTE